MFTPEVEKYTYYANKISSLSKIYSNYLINKVNTNPFIVVLNITPIFIINFLVNFSDIVIIVTKTYDFKKDPLFDLKGNYDDFEKYSTLIKGLYWNALRVNEKIRAGDKITDKDLIYTNKQIPVVKQKVDVSKAVNRYNTKKLPVLIIDATNIDSTAYIPVNTVHTYEMLKIGKPESNELVYKNFDEKGEISEKEEDNMIEIEHFNRMTKNRSKAGRLTKSKIKSSKIKPPQKKNIRESQKKVEVVSFETEPTVLSTVIDQQKSGSDSGDSDFLSD